MTEVSNARVWLHGWRYELLIFGLSTSLSMMSGLMMGNSWVASVVIALLTGGLTVGIVQLYLYWRQ